MEEGLCETCGHEMVATVTEHIRFARNGQIVHEGWVREANVQCVLGHPASREKLDRLHRRMVLADDMGGPGMDGFYVCAECGTLFGDRHEDMCSIVARAG